MGCQQEIAQAIVHQEADDVLALKANPGTLYDTATLFLADARAHGLSGTVASTLCLGGGRLETRTYWSTSELEGWGAKPTWAKLHSIGMVASRRECDTTVEPETRFSLTPLPPEAGLVARAVRSPWPIENRLHWGLDVSLPEDDCRIRTERGPATFAVLRHIALHLLQRAPHHKRGSKARRKQAGWNRQYLLQVPTGEGTYAWGRQKVLVGAPSCLVSPYALHHD
jgi:predicted transposase YbfD/YdcC